MGRSDRRKVAVHQRVTVMECEDEATLVEVLQKLEGVDLHLKPLGLRAVAFPACELEKVRRALEEHKCYPRIVGTPFQETPTSDPKKDAL